MAEVGALVWKGVLEERLAGEVLEVRIVDPALADALVGQPVDVFEQQQPDHEAGLDAGPALVAVQRGDLAVDPRARNRSPDIVVSCFFGRILPSEARTESWIV